MALLREGTGSVAHAALLAWWLWIVLSTAPQLRRGIRDRRARTQILMIRPRPSSPRRWCSWRCRWPS